MQIKPTLIIVRAAIISTSLLACLLAPSSASAGTRTLLAPQSGDLAAAAVIAPAAVQKSIGAPDTRREPIALSWAAEGDIAPPAAPYTARSREYYAEVSAAELGAGVAIHTSAPRAVIRLQPLGGASPREAAAIHPLALLITNAAGRAFAAGSGMEQLVTADKLAKADLPFAPGTSAFRLHPDLGSGSFTMQAAGLSGSERYLINVVEPDSKVVLSMQTNASTYLHGHTLNLQAQLLEMDGDAVRGHFAFGRFEGQLISPGGRSFALTMRGERDGSMHAALVLDADEAPAPGLWEVQASGQASVHGQQVMRTVRLAFPVAMPVARLSGVVDVQASSAGLGLRLGVEAGASGRYEVRGLLYGSVNGAMVPLAVADAAQWIDGGSGVITLSYANALLDGAHGPFELRDLTLLDQGRMGVLQRQQRALVIDERELVHDTASPAGAAAPALQMLSRPVSRGKGAPDSNS